MTLEPRTRLGFYEILGPLGAGGMGEVYRARDARLGREVALKVLPDALAREAERQARFDREARLLASLNHAAIATVHGFEEAEGVRFLVLELVPGETLEERIYRHRCVEAWSMVIPWVGIPLADVLKRFQPNSRAKYVAFKTLLNRAQMPGQRSNVLDWPYVEGLRIDEAMHPLSLLAVGLYGEVLPNQNGAPLRLVVPWKYGFKSIKSIVRVTFVENQPPTSWNRQAAGEYGFYSNVNPEVDHPRWSQATERRIGQDGLFTPKRKTLMFNGYGDQVASLYAGMDLKRFY